MARLIDSLKGHDSVWTLLLESRAAGRLPHAMAFTGPPGVGKRHMAWALAQTLLCEREAAPCGECGSCRRVESFSSESVLAIEPQNGSIKLEAAGQILEFLSLRRLSRARAVIVDQAQLLNAQTANALLKSIEEPPPETHFILIVPEISQLLPTLRSRVQTVRFSPLPMDTLSHLQDEPVEDWMLRSARGSLQSLELFKNPDTVEIRRLALDFLLAAGSDSRASLEQAQAEAKDRETALQFLRLVQQLLRDWSVPPGEWRIHRDLEGELERLPAVETSRRVTLWREAHQAETDLLGNVDRALLLENFYYRARQAMR